MAKRQSRGSRRHRVGTGVLALPLTKEPVGVNRQPRSCPPIGELIGEGSDYDVHRVLSGTNGVFDGPPVGDNDSVEFDTLACGADDPEGIGYHPTRGTSRMVDFQTDRVLELNRELMLITASNQINAAGIMAAPVTDDSNRLDLYIVDRGIDDKLHELSVALPQIPNLAPITTAGQHTATQVGEPAAARDDGRPQSPGAASSQQTSATLSSASTYQLGRNGWRPGGQHGCGRPRGGREHRARGDATKRGPTGVVARWWSA
jgi:hypothetical protein